MTFRIAESEEVYMYDAYSKLANAIILKAVSDYRSSGSQRTQNEIKRFFRSEWFEALTDLDGEKIIKKLEQERNGK